MHFFGFTYRRMLFGFYVHTRGIMDVFYESLLQPSNKMSFAYSLLALKNTILYSKLFSILKTLAGILTCWITIMEVVEALWWPDMDVMPHQKVAGDPELLCQQAYILCWYLAATWPKCTDKNNHDHNCTIYPPWIYANKLLRNLVLPITWLEKTLA